MGLYINPNTDKMDWLQRNSTKLITGVPTEQDFYDTPNDSFIVCYVDNGFFDALAVAFDLRELKAFTDPGDPRSKLFAVVPKNNIKRHAPDYDHYVREG